MQVLRLRVTKALPPAAKPLTLREVVRMLGKLGGHLGRNGDGEPGVLILWRGWMRLYESVEMLHSLQSAGLGAARLPMRYCGPPFEPAQIDLIREVLKM